MKKFILILLIIFMFQGCYTRKKLITEVKKWDKVEIVKEDGLRVWKENGTYYYQEQDGEPMIITYGNFVDYMVNVFKP